MNAQLQPATPETDIIQHLKLADLQPDPEQPRKYFDETALQELADDIRARGIIEPIIYFIDDAGKNTILAGERRYRAAKLAKLKTVPCLLREASEPVDRLLDQVSENLQREGLNPIEMALFFERLITLGTKPTKIPEVLDKHGFKAFDRSYISNFRRLLQLPDWAQDMIQAGTLTAAHGKHLLTAVKSEKVMAHVKTFLEKQPFTTVDLKEEIEEAFDENHINVNSSYACTEEGTHVRIVFDTKEECKGCTTCQRIKNNWGREYLYCLDETCFFKKQEAAQKKIDAAEKRREKAAEKKAQKALEQRAKENNNTIEQQQELDKAEAILQTPMDDPRASSRRERTQAYLDSWLRIQLNAHLQEDEATRYQVVLYMAAGAPGDYGHSSSFSYAGCGNISIHNDLDNSLTDDGIELTLKAKMDPQQLELMTCKAGIRNMSRKNLRALAQHCGIKLEGSYTIDKDYLDIKIKDEIIGITPQAVIHSYDDGEWEKTCKKPSSVLKDRIIDRDYLFGVPADLAEMYNDFKRD